MFIMLLFDKNIFFHKKDSDKDLSLLICHSLKNEQAKFSGFHFLLTYFSENALTIDLIEESIFILQNFSISSVIS